MRSGRSAQNAACGTIRMSNVGSRQLGGNHAMCFALRSTLLANVISGAAFSAATAAAEEITGEIVEVFGTRVKVAVKAEATNTVAVGDPVEVFYLLPEIEEEASVGTGKVSGVFDGVILAAIDNASGEIQVGQSARIRGITAANPVSSEQAEQFWRGVGKLLVPDFSSAPPAATSDSDQRARPARPWLGAHSEEVSAELARQQNLPRTFGMLLASIYPGSPAEKAGLQAGDIVIKANETWIANSTAWNKFAETKKPHEKVALVYVRDWRTHEASVPFAPWPPDTEWIRILQPLAEQGDASALHLLAVHYAEGLGVKKDETQARSLLEQASAKEYAPAQVGSPTCICMDAAARRTRVPRSRCCAKRPIGTWPRCKRPSAMRITPASVSTRILPRP